MAVPLETAPVLSTPDTHIFEDPTPAIDTSNLTHLSEEQISLTYEVERTVKEIREGRWRRIALQFPDHMLVDAPRVYDAVAGGLRKATKTPNGTIARQQIQKEIETEVEVDLATKLQDSSLEEEKEEEEEEEERLFILGDTSYGACCVDEVAAEHVDADVVVHYGRSCLSPPSRLPVIYVFTERPLDLDSVASAFRETYPNKDQKIILMADIPFQHHIAPLHSRLQQDGYTNIYATELLHNPSSPLPNRTTPSSTQDQDPKEALREHQLFHISEPPPSLLLILSSRVSSIHIYSTTQTQSSSPPTAHLSTTTSTTLRRRYALLTSLSTTPIFGILINTLSVRNYLTVLSHIQHLIASAGKKSYTFVVGKINAAKIANFSEIGGWVVIGCWESSLIESKEFWRPIITPFELELALKGDEERVWTGEWEADFMGVLGGKGKGVGNGGADMVEEQRDGEVNGDGDGDYDSEEESAPPEFDLRTGRYVSHSRPMRAPKASRAEPQQQLNGSSSTPSSTALTKRANGDVAHIGGVLSPGAEYLRSQRTWQGLGSDFVDQGGEDGSGNGNGNGEAARIEEGRNGIARGYVVGDNGTRH
ncbi:putative diphthamide synthesis protein-domain-containing protein [Dendryphion nanum]|uniref:2-(3-amino-3-carboxypropyl)histidine synthase subunit 2 n=1 Tax=Dendryphion nanum TaxID=256645 RepID=A0A9P9EE67_9PLEO|nr:putative diphthamide synthesis protein-domain-containing protein [Dendryphion nanum]